MHLHTRNVNTAFRTLVQLFHRGHADGSGEPIAVRRPSRNGPVLMIDEPVTVTYTHPRERVLFNAARDCNPFTHLYEALWMLAGRNDVAPVAYYASNMANYSDDGKRMNGAYGYRWKYAKSGQVGDNWSNDGDPITVNQLDILVNHLKADPTSRRAVLQMWNVEDDLLKIGTPCEGCDGEGSKMYEWAKTEATRTGGHKVRLADGSGSWYYVTAEGREIGMKTIGGPCSKCGGQKTTTSKDVCCNLSVMFSLRDSQGVEESFVPMPKYLDMTVTNRSNDLVWGMLGADYVHFTFLQEYMAARLEAEVGLYHHFTNNLHAYESNWKPDEWLAAERYDGSDRERNEPYSEAFPGIRNFVPLVRDPAAFERELPLFVEQYADPDCMDKPFREYTEPFLRDVAQPALDAFMCYKRKAAAVFDHCAKIKVDDWRIACEAWLRRRAGKRVES